jgi:hypothetical protein
MSGQSVRVCRPCMVCSNSAQRGNIATLQQQCHQSRGCRALQNKVRQSLISTCTTSCDSGSPPATICAICQVWYSSPCQSMLIQEAAGAPRSCSKRCVMQERVMSHTCPVMLRGTTQSYTNLLKPQSVCYDSVLHCAAQFSA